MTNPHAVVEITNILPPYRVPLYRKLDALDGIDLTVLLLSESEPTRDWRPPKDDLGFDYHYLPGPTLELPLPGGRHRTHLNTSVVRQILDRDPEVLVLGGYAHISFWLAWIAARLRSTPLVLRNGTTLASSGSTDGWRGLAKSRFLKGFDAHVTYGTAASSYLLELGVQPERIYAGYNTVDMEFFRGQWHRNRGLRRERDDVDVSFLFVGRYLKKKGIDDLLAAAGRLETELERRGLAGELRFVGHGPLGERIDARRSEAGSLTIVNRGFVEPEKLPREYARADCLILPSREEPWGLVVNEALACGLTVIGSSAVGCAPDLLLPHWNGYLFTAGNVDELFDRMRAVVNQRDTFRDRREAISRFATEHFGLEQTVDAYRRALADVLPPREPPPNPSEPAV